jgi:ACS family allantoate permease-like MFS transporter
MDSDRSSYLSEDKKEELRSPGRPSATAKPALQEIKEEDADEARKLVGDERVIFSEEEMARVRSKIDWRVPPILAAVYFTVSKT